MLRFKFFTFFCLFFYLQTAQAAELNKVFFNNTQKGDYIVTFVVNDDVNYQLMTSENDVFMDVFATKFTIKKILKNLDAKFIKFIRKTNENNDIKLNLKLADNVLLKDNYSIFQSGQTFIVLVFENAKKITRPVVKDFSRTFIIMIDPGHGGIDKGATSSNLHILEKDITLEYAKELQKELQKYPQYKVFLTREKDVFMTPEARLKKAKQNQADIFISLHVDSHSDPRMRGASIYTLPQEAIVQETMNLIEKENKNNIPLKNDKLLKENEEIASVILNMVYQDTQNSSINLAKATSKALDGEIEMLNKAHRSLELKVLKGIDVPAILIELGYLSNPEEERELGSLRHKKLFIHALVQGINNYWKEQRQ